MNKVLGQKESFCPKKYFYVNIWHTKCSPCIAEMPIIDSIAEIYGKNICFIFLTEDSEEKVKETLNRKKIEFKNCILFNDDSESIDYLFNKTSDYVSFPTHFILNEKLEVLHTHSGAILGDMFDPILVMQLKKYNSLGK
jgi:thiol-disulfide isomerase/thioredoxin